MTAHDPDLVRWLVEHPEAARAPLWTFRPDLVPSVHAARRRLAGWRPDVSPDGEFIYRPDDPDTRVTDFADMD